MSAKNKISGFVESLLTQGKAVLGTEWERAGNWIGGAPHYVDLQQFKKWRASCNLLVSLLGDAADPWRAVFEGDALNQIETALSMQGTLEAIRDAIADDLLLRCEDLVFAEAFSDLVQQAEYLFDQGYILAAGVILRAVLEERLRRMCDRHAVISSRIRPTIADLNNELYKARVYDKITLKHVESMAAVGNDAAHASANLKAEDVQRFKMDLVSFLQRFSA